MKKYKIRVRVLPENVCCGWIVMSEYSHTALEQLFTMFKAFDVSTNEIQLLSIGEL